MNKRIFCMSLVVATILMSCITFAQAAGECFDDSAITRNVYFALATEFSSQISENVEVTVKTFQGVVILGGSASEWSTIKQAVDTASRVSGVKSVDNRMIVRSPF